MNIFGKFSIHKPSPDFLRIHRAPGLSTWLFILVYMGFVTCINSLFFVMLWEARLPRTLTCQQQSGGINCNYLIRGFISGDKLDIKDVEKAISSQKPNGETIVLTSSQPWISLGSTSENTQNIQSINQGLAQLNSSGENTWQIDMYAPQSSEKFIAFFFLPIGLLFLILGFVMILNQLSATVELDVRANTVILIRLGIFRTELSRFDQLSGADTQLTGYLGILSEKFGIYGGDHHYRRRNYRIIRLLFTNRRPFVFHQQKFDRDGGQKLITKINAFIADHPRSKPL